MNEFQRLLKEKRAAAKINHFGQSKEAEKSLTLRSYAALHKLTRKQTTEEIALAVNASCQSTGHVLGMMAKHKFVIREVIQEKKWWCLPLNPVPAETVARVMICNSAWAAFNSFDA